MQGITNFFFKMFKIMRFLRSSECSETAVELSFTAQKANACIGNTFFVLILFKHSIESI